jgi:hypothetical protein
VVKRRVEERISEVDGLLREKTKIRAREVCPLGLLM